jgi:hypothetical protein
MTLQSCLDLQVDIVQMTVLEFKDRAGRPYYHLERFIVSEQMRNDTDLIFRKYLSRMEIISNIIRTVDSFVTIHYATHLRFALLH